MREDSNKWITIDSTNKTSYITTTTGQYRCNVTNEAGSAISPVITVYGKNLLVYMKHTLKVYVCTHE